MSASHSFTLLPLKEQRLIHVRQPPPERHRQRRRFPPGGVTGRVVAAVMTRQRVHTTRRRSPGLCSRVCCCGRLPPTRWGMPRLRQRCRINPNEFRELAHPLAHHTPQLHESNSHAAVSTHAHARRHSSPHAHPRSHPRSRSALSGRRRTSPQTAGRAVRERQGAAAPRAAAEVQHALSSSRDMHRSHSQIPPEHAE